MPRCTTVRENLAKSDFWGQIWRFQLFALFHDAPCSSPSNGMCRKKSCTWFSGMPAGFD
jgi:hypothetical protein